jgi:hypothetical protein
MKLKGEKQIEKKEERGRLEKKEDERIGKKKLEWKENEVAVEIIKKRDNKAQE